MSRYFLIFFSCMQVYFQYRKKCILKICNFLLSRMILGFKFVLSTLPKWQCCFSLFKQLLETEMTFESTNHCKRMHFQESELMFCVALKVKSETNQI